ncbi:hypothetical protein Hanom_Chr02g00147201 [Helianthus anomalus]
MCVSRSAEKCIILNGNEPKPYEILTAPTNTNFLRIFYIYEINIGNLLCFRTLQNANLNEKRDYRSAPTTKRKYRKCVLLPKLKFYHTFSFVIKF